MELSRMPSSLHLHGIPEDWDHFFYFCVVKAKYQPFLQMKKLVHERESINELKVSLTTIFKTANSATSTIHFLSDIISNELEYLFSQMYHTKSIKEILKYQSILGLQMCPFILAGRMANKHLQKINHRRNETGANASYCDQY